MGPGRAAEVKMKQLVALLIAVLLAAVLTSGPMYAQTSQDKLQEKAAKVKTKIRELGSGERRM
jgi:hypothetical protein